MPTLQFATFVGEPGHSYEFYSVARDNAGNLEAIPAVPQAHTQIAGGNTPPELVNPISEQKYPVSNLSIE